MENITREYLEENGFKRYSDPASVAEASALYQKKYIDEFGNTRFFLNVYEFDFRPYNINREDIPDFKYQAEAQLYRRGTHEAFNITFLFDSLESCLEMIEELFKNGMIENYDGETYISSYSSK